MFTGIISYLGQVQSITVKGDGAQLVVRAKAFSSVKPGESVSVNGVCLTVVSKKRLDALFQLGPETLARTTFGKIKRGDRLNIELSLRLSDRLGGHVVQGHIDGTAKVARVSKRKGSWQLTLTMPRSFLPSIVEHGSIAVDGVSLTVVQKKGASISIMLMAYMLGQTTLKNLVVGDRVNIELDLLGKYVQQFLNSYESKHL